MARITVEDCTPIVKNRFELSVLAGYRAKEISKGSQVTITKQENDKDTVTALREIAEEGVLIDDLRDAYIRSMQKNAHADDLLEEETQNVDTDIVEADNEMQDTSSKTTTEESSTEESAEDYISVDDYTFEDENDLED
jgi:DNA-directed RNA polymerase subunit omega